MHDGGKLECVALRLRKIFACADGQRIGTRQRKRHVLHGGDLPPGGVLHDQLFAEIDDLNGGQEALEERARNELSMTRPGETFYRLVPDASKRAQSAGQNNR